jgi:prepilin-type N-terminal cleavage/methylation domain-containing protein
MKSDKGFSIVELMIATAVTVILLAATVGMLSDSVRLSSTSDLMSDLQQNLRAGLNFMVQDFISAGWKIPMGGIQVPSGANMVVRPGPVGSNLGFNGIIFAVNPGTGLGPISDGRGTDIVNILYADPDLQLDGQQLTSIGANGTTATVNSATPITGTNVSNPIQEGDLILFSNALGNAVQYVTSVEAQTMNFAGNDPAKLNQPAAPNGSIKAIANANGTFPPTSVRRIFMITYFLDTQTDPAMPRLVRCANYQPCSAIALVLEDLRLTYSVSNNVNIIPDITVFTGAGALYSPNQIRNVSILASGRSAAASMTTKDYVRQSLNTQVSLRSLCFVNRFNTNI